MEVIISFLKKLNFLFYKATLRCYAKNSNYIFAYPFLVFLQFELDTVFELEGMEAAQCAVYGFHKTKVESIRNLQRLAAREPVVVVEGVYMNFVRYAPDDTPPVTVSVGDIVATLKDVKFTVVAHTIRKWRSLLGEGPVEVWVNGKKVNAGYWIMPGDYLTLKTKAT
jgi:hypothetical protein